MYDNILYSLNYKEFSINVIFTWPNFTESLKILNSDVTCYSFQLVQSRLQNPWLTRSIFYILLFNQFFNFLTLKDKKLCMVCCFMLFWLKYFLSFRKIKMIRTFSLSLLHYANICKFVLNLKWNSLSRDVPVLRKKLIWHLDFDNALKISTKKIWENHRTVIFDWAFSMK